jgi:hypothetical protein
MVEVKGGHRVQFAGIVAPPRDTACGTAATDASQRLLSDNGRDAWAWVEMSPDRPAEGGIAYAYLWVEDGDGWYLLDELLAFLGYAHAWTGGGHYVERINVAEWDAYQNARGCLWQ